jgi:hypothetical protein
MYLLSKLLNGFIVLIFLSLPICAQKWSKIKVFQFNRADVENLLGKPTENGEFASRFDFPDEQITVFYSDGKCNYDLFEDWKTSIGLVEQVGVKPKSKKELTKAIIKKWDLSLGYQGLKTKIYENKENGVEFVVDKINEKYFITYIKLVPNKEKQSLICMEFSENCFNRVFIEFVSPETFTRGDLVEISALVGGLGVNQNIKISWKTSSGSIIEGQGTFAIKLDTDQISEKSIILTAKVKREFSNGKYCRKIAEKTIIQKE